MVRWIFEVGNYLDLLIIIMVLFPLSVLGANAVFDTNNNNNITIIINNPKFVLGLQVDLFLSHFFP